MLKSKIEFDNYIYTIYDTVSNIYRGTFYHVNDKEMIKITLPSLLMEFPLRDIKIYRIGRFSSKNGVIESIPRKQVSTDCYLFPHSRLSSVGDDLSLEELDKGMKETKNKIIASQTSNDDKKQN